MGALALVGPSWPLRGGIARTTTALAAALAARETLAAFLVPSRQYPKWLYPGTADIDTGACQRLEFAESCFGVMEPWTWSRLARRIERARPDALVFPYWTSAWAPLQVYLARSIRAPVVTVVHNAADHDAGLLARRASRAVLRRSDGFLCHASEVAHAVTVAVGPKPITVHPLPPGGGAPANRNDARARLGIPPERIAVLCFGLIRPYKGVDVLLEAMAQLPRDRNLLLLLAGEPWGRLGPELARRLVRPDLDGRVISHLSWVPEERAADWFAAADVAVLPYRSATGSAVAAQALGFGLPLVASSVGGLRDVVEDDANGLLVPPGDVDALSGALSRVADPDVRARLAAGARDAASRWSWESYAKALELLVERARAARSLRTRVRDA